MASRSRLNATCVCRGAPPAAAWVWPSSSREARARRSPSDQPSRLSAGMPRWRCRLPSSCAMVDESEVSERAGACGRCCCGGGWVGGTVSACSAGGGCVTSRCTAERAASCESWSSALIWSCRARRMPSELSWAVIGRRSISLRSRFCSAAISAEVREACWRISSEVEVKRSVSEPSSEVTAVETVVRRLRRSSSVRSLSAAAVARMRSISLRARVSASDNCPAIEVE